MKARAAVACAIACVGGFVAGPGSAQAEDDLLTRPALFDVPGGPLQDLKSRGIDLYGSLTQFYQGLVAGEGDQNWEYGGKVDLIGTFVGQKLGLWKGLIVNAHFEYVYGSDVNFQGDGSIFPINTALAFPTLGGYDTDLSLVVTQMINDEATISIGKFNMLDVAAKTPLLGGGGIDTFMNTALAAPITGVTPPYILGAIATYDPGPVKFTFMAYDPRNAQNPDVFEDPFATGVVLSVIGTVPVTIHGLNGWQNLRVAYSTQDGFDFEDIPQLILPPETRDIETKDGSWYIGYSFQQYLVQEDADPTRGWGVFGYAAISDGNPNPIQYAAFLGLGGNSLLPGRSDDRFGVGYFYYGLADSLKDGLRGFGLDYGNESGLEVFYNAAVTPWFRLSGDLQVIQPSNGDETAVFLGLRGQLIAF
ncbi:MAG: carbohydrate porin [Hyphomicrobiales bacterium]